MRTDYRTICRSDYRCYFEDEIIAEVEEVVETAAADVSSEPKSWL